MASAYNYHKETSYRRDEQKGHMMDWQNQPRLFKSYPEALARIPLFTAETFTKSSLWKATEKDMAPEPINFTTLSTLLALTQTFTAKARQPSGEFYFRSAASAGALYPNEIYVCANNNIDTMDAGVYYYDVFQKSLTMLRKENPFPFLQDAVPGMNHNPASVSFFISAIFNRSSWKYRERAYRYVLLDGGHMLQNLFFALRALNIAFTFGYDFIDHPLNELLGVDDQKEVCLAWVNLLGSPQIYSGQKSGKLPDLPKSIKSAGQTATVESPYSQILEMHKSGNIESLNNIPEPDAFSPPINVCPQSKIGQEILLAETLPNARSYPDALFMRRSKRNFVHQKIPYETLHHLLALLDSQSTLGSNAHIPYQQSIAVGFLADAVDGIDSGFYLCDFSQHTYGRIEDGFFQTLMAAICLEQTWLKNGGLHFLFMTDLKEIDHRWGARGYRYAMMEAGKLGQALYVGATALGLGCCGIGALFDFEAQELLSLKDSSFLLYLVAVGATKS